MSTIYVLCLALCIYDTIATCCLSGEEGIKRWPVDCSDIDIKKGTGLYTIYPKGFDGFNVFCDMDSENVNGGWTVFQRRIDGETDFYRDWDQYKAGFGNLNKEFWLGNDRLHLLTSGANYELLIMLSDFENHARYAKYSNFKIGDEASNYKLTFDHYKGNAGDSLIDHNGRPFSTLDRDNDAYADNCASLFKGAWWYGSCHISNLNGQYLRGNHSSYANGINWKEWKGYHYSLKSTTMMIRKIK